MNWVEFHRRDLVDPSTQGRELFGKGAARMGAAAVPNIALHGTKSNRVDVLGKCMAYTWSE